MSGEILGSGNIFPGSKKLYPTLASLAAKLGHSHNLPFLFAKLYDILDLQPKGLENVTLLIFFFDYSQLLIPLNSPPQAWVSELFSKFTGQK
jgi:hypothetical protein